MKNTILKFDDDDTFDNDLIVPDYFSKSIHISDLIESNDNYDWNEYLDTYKITDNDKLERISYELYGTTDYWDLLLMINNRDPLFEMPYDYDLLEDESTSIIDAFATEVYSMAPLTATERLEALKEEILSNMIQFNEEYRFIKVPKPTKINEFIQILKDEDYL